MARTYKRDARGRFSGGGGGSSGGGGGKKVAGGSKKAASSTEAKASPRIGRKYDTPAAKPSAEPKAKAKGGGGSKAAATKAANKANTDRLVSMGQTGIGSRLKKTTARSYSGTKATKDKMAQSWANAGGDKREMVPGQTRGANWSKARQSSTMSRRRK